MPTDTLDMIQTTEVVEVAQLTQPISMQQRLVNVCMLHQQMATLQAKLCLMEHEREQQEQALVDELNKLDIRTGDHLKVTSSIGALVLNNRIDFYEYKSL